MFKWTGTVLSPDRRVRKVSATLSGGGRGRVTSYLRSHPMVVLLIFSPGLIEYLSGSSALTTLVLNPAFFVFQVALNIGLYGPGVLLIREAKLRWKKGWATVLLLGLAYGILEEGIALSTMFDPRASPVVSSGLAGYGHFAGVNWPWAAQIDIVHALFSIAIPILLLDLTLPETRGRSLLHGRQIPLTFAIWAGDVALLNFLVWKWVGFWAGVPLILGSFSVIAVFVLAAWRVPSQLLAPKFVRPRSSALTFAVTGFLFYLGLLLSALIPKSRALPPAVAIAGYLFVGGTALFWVLRSIGSRDNERRLVALIGGLFVFILVDGIVSQISLPIVLGADAGFLLFLRWLWKKYPGGAPTPAPAVEPRLALPPPG